jgi:hypothetical protein
MNKALHDRLVKELRLRALSTLSDANAFLPALIEDPQVNVPCRVPPAEKYSQLFLLCAWPGLLIGFGGSPPF